MKILTSVLATFCFLIAGAQDAKIDPKDVLSSGPMLGYSAMREVMIWAQTEQEAEVKIIYWQKGMPSPLFETETVTTEKQESFTAHLLADEVMPGITYSYKLYINGESVAFDYPLEFQSAPDWAYKSEPPSFSVAVGSCVYINDQPYDRKGEAYGQNTDIFQSIHKKDPDLMLWLGDNTYYREADWDTKTGMHYRNTHTRKTVDMQPLLANTHHYATWDDHDYGPNDHNRTFIHKAMSLEVFQRFWANPTYGFLDESCAVTMWSWADVDFYMLDDRWFRSANHIKSNEKNYFGKKQIDWLIENLKASRANFKIIGNGGQVLNPAKKYENYANYEEERAYFLKRLTEENIWGLYFLSGDRHHTELTEIPRPNNYPLRDLTVSPLTSSSHSSEDEGNVYQQDETLVTEQNFAILRFEGTRKERIMHSDIFDRKGKLLWTKKYELSDFRPPRKY